MEHMFTRLEWLVGKEKLENLGTKSVALFGLRRCRRFCHGSISAYRGRPFSFD